MALKKTPAVPKHFGDKDAAVAEFLKLLAELIARDWHRRALQNANGEPNTHQTSSRKSRKDAPPPGSPS